MEYHFDQRWSIHVIKRVLFLVTCVFVLMGASDPYGVALREARRLLQEKRYEEASQAYEVALALDLCDPVRRDALFELARCYEASELWNPAIGTYRELLAELGDLTGRNGEWVQAQGGLSKCYFKEGRYESAFEATLSTRGLYPFSFGCGLGFQAQAYQQVLREAVLGEYVRIYDFAVSAYLRTAQFDYPKDHLRLLNLYERAGQLPDLLRMVEEEDQRYAETMRKYRKGCEDGGYCPPEHSGLFRTIHGILEVRDLEKAGNWQALVSILGPESPGGGREHPDHEVREAARLLARNPSETLPLLLPNVSRRGYYAYALGLTGAPEALAALKDEARKEKNFSQAFTLVDDLLAAGPEGEAALDDLYPSAQGNLKFLIDRYRQGTLNDLGQKSSGGYEEFPFPPIPERIRLPNQCTYHGPPASDYNCLFVQEGSISAEAVESKP
jgi:tetratricopeptide (TPR) repeat protein